MKPALQHLGWLLLFFLVALLLQGLQGQSYFDGDTGYHLAVGHYTLQHGILHEFPWTPFSWLGKHYADKELALHLLLAPLSTLDPDVAARIAGTLLGGVLLWAVYGVLQAERVPRPGLWALAMLACSGAFAHRFVLIRPHLMSIPLAVIVLWAAARGRWKTLALACLVYPFCYTAWHLPLVLAVLGGGGRLLARQDRPWLPPVVAGLALGAGVLLHPNFPENLSFFWIQNVEVLFGTAWSDRVGFELGTEFRPFSPLGYVRYALLPLLAGLTALGLVGRQLLQERRADALALAATPAALGMALMTSQTQRFIEYLVPFAVVALAVALGTRARPVLGPALLALSVAWTGLLGRHPLEMLADRSIMFPPKVEEAVQQLVPEGSQVFHCDWLTVGEMMLALPDRRFLFGLDPVLFYRGDPEAYTLWFELLHEPRPNPSADLRRVIGADYVLCDTRPEWAPFLATLDQDPGMSDPIQVGNIILYKVLPTP